MITLQGLTKRYGGQAAVDNLSLTIAAGRVTGFLGPNGAGKSTTMRMIMGLDHPTSGQALVGGRPYAELAYPLREIGALLDAKAVHPGRSARAHLRALARTNGIPVQRVDEVLETVGLTSVANRRAGSYSLGMGQRLGIAGALLGNPGVVMFDEPVNGLDPDGVRWIRGLMRGLAAEGRTVFVSSHLMSEMQLTADHLVIIGKGRLITETSVKELIDSSSLNAVRVRGADQEGLKKLVARLHEWSVPVRWESHNELYITGLTVDRVSDVAYELGIRLHEVRSVEASLEQAYMELTADSVEFGAASGHQHPGAGA
ncbi:ABC transporter ATP-binding protein [Streptomyces sp. V4I2]|uniref:ABC transporter ATP-binding protein n=1 Tax=Streptomyces sp. V4I2 TaxID=3042280 RepID=UPI002785AA6D|nr:ABC transporter ATP-binding protein [Streptomyces sp. V4I2]MDQ1044982.1 ABC-2 type transport system ATP-binding protein [Streptomyces sp. V4I2]